MGILGDYLGHRRALLLTKALVVLGALMCLRPHHAVDGRDLDDVIFWKTNHVFEGFHASKK